MHAINATLGSSGIRMGMSTGLIAVQVKAAEVEVDGLAEWRRSTPPPWWSGVLRSSPWTPPSKWPVLPPGSPVRCAGASTPGAQGPGSAVVVRCSRRCSSRRRTMRSSPASTSQSRPVNGRFSGVHEWPVLAVARGSEISKHWAARPLDSYNTTLNCIGTTPTKTALSVRTQLVDQLYEKDVKITDAQMHDFPISHSITRTTPSARNQTENRELFLREPLAAPPPQPMLRRPAARAVGRTRSATHARISASMRSIFACCPVAPATTRTWRGFATTTGTCTAAKPRRPPVRSRPSPQAPRAWAPVPGSDRPAAQLRPHRSLRR